VLGLQFTLDLLGEQAFEEGRGRGAEFREALLQQPRSLLGIGGGMMAIEDLPHADARRGDESMAGDLLQAGRVNDDFTVGDADRQDLTDVGPGDGVEVETMCDGAFHIHMMIDDEGVPRRGH